jgi:hypothetical protein
MGTMAGAPAGVGPFTVFGHVDDFYGDVELGLNVMPKNSGASFNFTYHGQFSGDTMFHGASFMVGVPF